MNAVHDAVQVAEATRLLRAEDRWLDDSRERLRARSDARRTGGRPGGGTGGVRRATGAEVRR
jgi:hypothetical protein